MENNNLTLGSLFDGSGGFPLGGLISGITPLWASEVEPFPIRVTTKRLPDIQHYGDVSKLNGAEVPPVDIITFGSPCQDMSVAGKRSGLDGERSSLFYQAVRIVKEMRCKTNGKYPRFVVWENVPGAFSSNKGEDFKAVLEEICKIKDEEFSVPQSDKWTNAGEIVGEQFSLAWRVFDAQYWGVPQRRKRIYLVADFAGRCAGKILFESEGVSGYPAKGICPWQGAAGNTQSGTGTAGIGIDGYNGCADEVVATLGVNCGMATGRNGVMVLNDQGGNRMDVTEDMTCTLRAESNHPPLVFENHSQDTRYTGPLEQAPTVSSTYGTGGNNQPFVLETPKTLKIRSGCEGGGKGALIQDDLSATLGCNNDQTLFVPKAYGICSKDSNSMKSDNPHSGIYEADTSRTLDANGGNPACNQGGIVVVEGNGSRPSHKGDGYKKSEVMYTLNTIEQHAVVYAIDRESYNCGQNYARKMGISEDGVSSTLNAQGPSAVAAPVYSSSKASFFTSAEEELASTLVATDYKDPPIVNDVSNVPEYIVRRLTPTECARLQGFPSLVDIKTEDITRDEVALIALAAGFIVTNPSTGEVFGTRGPGGLERETPIRLKGSVVNEYRVYNIHAAGVKKQIRANRLMWMSVYGAIPDGYVVDHINNDKQDNSISNLQILTPEANSHKAQADGLYLSGDACKSSRISESDRKKLSFLYWNTDKPFSYYAKMFGISNSRAQQIIHEYEWCSDLDTAEPTEEEIKWWTEVFETHRHIMGTSSKPKIEKQITKWLKNPHSDSAEYKMWGNGVALPNVVFVLSGIVYYTQNEGR